MLSIRSEIPLPGSGRETYKDIAFDGRCYYLLLHRENRLVVLDDAFHPVRNIKTSRLYAALCYDPHSDGFFAASDTCPATLFRLDRTGREHERLMLHPETDSVGAVSSLSYNAEDGRLLAASGNRLLEINPADGKVRVLLEEAENARIQTVASLPSHTVFCVLRGAAAYLVLTAGGEPVAEEALETGADALLPDTAADETTPGAAPLLLLTNKRGGGPELLRVFCGEEMSRMPCSYQKGPDNGEEKTACENGREICRDRCVEKEDGPCDRCEEAHGGKDNDGACHFCRKPCGCSCDACPCCRCCNPCCRCCDDCSCCRCREKDGCLCGDRCCHCREKGGAPCEPPCPSHRRCACSDILESIALQEAALAHILNAEGEKLQKVVTCSAKTCELLDVNESVQKTILHVTHLEQVLFSKLESLQSICCFCE